MAKRETAIQFKMWVPLTKHGDVYVSKTKIHSRRRPAIWDSNVDRFVWANVTIVPTAVQPKQPKPKRRAKR